MLVSVFVANAAVFVAGRVFHVRPDSVQLVFPDPCTTTGTLPLPLIFPCSRSLAEDTLVRAEISKRT